MPVAGVDVGSVAAKAVVLDEEKKIVLGRAVLPTGWNSREAGEQVLQAACRAAGVEPAGLRRVVGTGYGRVALPFADKVVTEISCHARGASWLFPATGVVLDIGGQDSKVIAVEDGAVQDFVMNDKCAAGTGRFLDVMARVLEVKVEDLGTLGGRDRTFFAGLVRYPGHGAAGAGAGRRHRQTRIHLQHVRCICGDRDHRAAGAGDGPGRHRCGGIPVHRTPYAGAGSTYPVEGRMHLYRWAGYQSGIQRTACGGAGSTGQCP